MKELVFYRGRQAKPNLSRVAFCLTLAAAAIAAFIIVAQTA